jgi:SRSO17 transposase
MLYKYFVSYGIENIQGSAILLPSTPEERFYAYMNFFTATIGLADRAELFRNYCSGLLLPGERKSVEPMAARIDPVHVRQGHQCMHHFIADAPWSDDSVMKAVIDYTLPFSR